MIFDTLDPPARQPTATTGCPGVVRCLSPIVLAWLVGCHASPRDGRCREPELQERTQAMNATAYPIDLLADMPVSPSPVRPERTSPLAFVRAGDALSRPAIAAARRALDAHACGAIRDQAARLPSSHPDRDYIQYLAACCERQAGNHRDALPALAGLVHTQDASLAPFVARQLAVLLARDGTAIELARSSLASLGLWRGPILDLYASELLAAGRFREAVRVVEHEPAGTPEASELACRAQAEQCRAVPRRAPGQLAACRVPRIRASEDCERWLRLGLLRALVDFPGETDHRARPIAAPWVPELIAGARDEVPTLRDRLDLVALAATYEVRNRDAGYWTELADRAGRPRARRERSCRGRPCIRARRGGAPERSRALRRDLRSVRHDRSSTARRRSRSEDVDDRGCVPGRRLVPRQRSEGACFIARTARSTASRSGRAGATPAGATPPGARTATRARLRR